MIDWIKSWFGKGRVRVEWEGFDRSGLKRSGNARAPYVGVWDEEAMKDYISQKLSYQHGIMVTSIKIVAHIEE